MSARRRGQTLAVRAALESDHQHGSVVPPIFLSSNYTFAGYGKKRQYDYTRSANPTRDALADALAELEQGAGAVITSTGMSAVLLVCQLLQPGDRLIAPSDCYGGTYRLFTKLAAKGHFEVDFIDQTDPVALAEAAAGKPRMWWVETPTNPLLRIVDLELVCTHAQTGGAMMVVDNTFLSPARQTPITQGADLVVHSTTKYLNGHSDVVGGAVVASTAQLQQQMVEWANAIGVTGAPFDSYLTLRGVRTLHARMRAHEENAAAVVATLQAHSAVARVYYPGIPSHPGHAVAARQQGGFGGMVSFELQGGEPQVCALLDGLECFSLAESLGGVESLVCHPASMTHAPMDPDTRRKAGIGDTLIRLSVGIEHAEDLCADLEAALDAAARAGDPDAQRAAG